MPFWSLNHSPRAYREALHFISFPRFQSKIASRANFYGPTYTESGASAHVWFVKVVCTLCVRCSSSLNIFYSDYFRNNLGSLIAFDVIKHVNFSFNSPNLALSFFQITRLNLNLVHSLDTYNLLLRSFCQMGLYDSAKLILDYMRVDGYLPNSSLVGFLVLSFANAGRFEIAMELLIGYAQSENGKVLPVSFLVFNNLLSLLVKRNRPDEAVVFFRNHILCSNCYAPDTSSFNIVIRGLCRLRKVDEAFEIFSDMGRFSCLPDIITYNTLLNGLCCRGDVDRAHELLKDIYLQSGLSPDVVTYTSLLSGYCKLGKMEEALNLFDEMIGHAVMPSLFTFNVLIDGFCKVGNMVSALSMYEMMLAYACHPDVVTFTSIIYGHCRLGELHQGLKVWYEMKARNLHPNLYTFSVLISAMCKENRLNEARNLLKELNLRGDIIPQPFIYNPVIDGFCKAGNVDEANVIVREMEEQKCSPDKVTFTVLIIGHCMKGRMFEAISLFNRMLAVGCVPDAITVNNLIPCLLKAGMPKEAFDIKKTATEGLNSLPFAKRNTAFKTTLDIPVAV